MAHTEDIDHSISVAKKALRLMIDLGMAASPNNFELFYTFLSGQNRQLSKDVKKAISSEKPLSQATTAALYKKFLSQDQASEEMSEISNRVSEEVNQIARMIRDAAGSTEAYGESLGSMTRQLDGAVDQDSLKSIVENLVTSTKTMADNNKELETRLQDSQTQIDTLNQDLEIIRNEALTDPLTGIPNRKLFDQQIEILAAEASEQKLDFCMLIADIDFFKKFNDTYGHQTGDQVLKLVARTLKDNLKGRDVVARYGGEEFAVLLPITTLQPALILANQIRESIKSKTLVNRSTGENLGTITMSIGVARYRYGEPIEAFIGRADTCLYAAKNSGRDKVMCETDPGIEIKPQVA